MPCSVDGCERKVYGHGYCGKHYQRWRTGRPLTAKLQGEQTDAERLALKCTLDPVTGCLNWNRPRKRDGRANVILFRGERIFGYRAAYQIHVGPVPEGMHVLHRCDNPLCCNPEHLWLGTHADNMADMAKKGRAPRRRGALNHKTLLTEDAVRSIRAAYATGEVTLKQLGLLHGVDLTTVHNVVSGKTWSYIK